MSRGQDVWGVAEVTWFVQPRENETEGEASWWSTASLWGEMGGKCRSLLWQQQDPKEQHGAVSGQVRLGVRDRFYTRAWWAWDRLSRGVVMDLSCQSSRSTWTTFSDLRHQIWIWGGPVWIQGLDSLILVGPFQFRIFYHSIIFIVNLITTCAVPSLNVLISNNNLGKPMQLVLPMAQCIQKRMMKQLINPLVSNMQWCYSYQNRCRSKEKY